MQPNPVLTDDCKIYQAQIFELETCTFNEIYMILLFV